MQGLTTDYVTLIRRALHESLDDGFTIFGVADVDGRPTPMRDWELLRLLNDMPIKGATTSGNALASTG